MSSQDILSSSTKDQEQEERICYVNSKNELLASNTKVSPDVSWCRATYILVMHEPPHLFYEPKEWSHTSVILLKGNTDSNGKARWELPGGMVLEGETYQASAVRRLADENNIDVCLPENCLHHLFKFPFQHPREEGAQQPAGIWGDCYESVFRGDMEGLHLPNAVCVSLAELKDMLEHDETSFAPDCRHALKLYFQRQGDLRAKRRLLKGYSSMDLEHYGLRDGLEGSRTIPVLMLDSFHDDVRNTAVDFTMKTDDGMCPGLLYQAEIVILGVSRTGKTPLSIFISQTAGLKVANIPLVFELQPPNELTDPRDPSKAIDPRRVFCLTRDVTEMKKLRQSRIEQALRCAPNPQSQESTYANFTYIRKDLAKARSFVKEYGYTEIDVSERALEECASIILSKMKERFPDMHIH